MMPFYGTKESAGWLIGGPGCGFAANASSKNLDAVKKCLQQFQRQMDRPLYGRTIRGFFLLKWSRI